MNDDDNRSHIFILPCAGTLEEIFANRERDCSDEVWSKDKYIKMIRDAVENYFR